MQARYYDPVIGRFYSNDPVGFTGDITTFNRYSYVGNNPYSYTDPTGTTRWKVNFGLKAVGITGGAFNIEASFDDETFELSVSAGGSVRAGGEVGTDISFTTEKSSYKGNTASAKATADVSLGLGEETAKYEGEYSTSSGGKHGGCLESALKIDSNGVNLDPNLGVSVGVGGQGEVNISIPDTINNVTNAISSAAKAVSEAVDKCMANPGTAC
ncbi:MULTISPECIES: RHS repeat-associated core domain-containing protein [unclassified Pseudoalteromonas]|uniref:RHS repeat-associated core domain-containing protein n=1 Tax=unclassified Pseudoalteromonas TaxID=194690 RepID=UPI0030157457